MKLSMGHSRIDTERVRSEARNLSRDYTSVMCRGSSVGIATRYGLDSPGADPGGGEIFRTRPDRPWDPPSLLYNGYQVFPGGKAAWAWL